MEWQKVTNTIILKDFRRWLIQEELKHKREIKIQELRYKQSPTTLLNNKAVECIEKLLQTPIEDHRKYCLWNILLPYLLNKKKISKEETFSILEKWLEICNQEKRIDFNINNKLKND